MTSFQSRILSLHYLTSQRLLMAKACDGYTAYGILVEDKIMMVCKIVTQVQDEFLIMYGPQVAQ